MPRPICAKCSSRAFEDGLCLRHYRERFETETGSPFDLVPEVNDAPIKEMMNGIIECMACNTYGCVLCGNMGYMHSGSYEPISHDERHAIRVEIARSRG